MNKLAKKERGCLFALLTILFLFFPGENLDKVAGQEKAIRPKSGGVLKIKAYGQTLNSDLDPAGDGYPLVIENLYEGLLKIDRNLEITPGLADYWVIDNGGRKTVFSLRSKADFHNGLPVTAADVKYSLEIW